MCKVPVWAGTSRASSRKTVGDGLTLTLTLPASKMMHEKHRYARLQRYAGKVPTQGYLDKKEKGNIRKKVSLNVWLARSLRWEVLQ